MHLLYVDGDATVKTPVAYEDNSPLTGHDVLHEFQNTFDSLFARLEHIENMLTKLTELVQQK